MLIPFVSNKLAVN